MNHSLFYLVHNNHYIDFLLKGRENLLHWFVSCWYKYTYLSQNYFFVCTKRVSVSKFLKFLQEKLPGLAASSAFVFRSIAFLFIYLPLSPSITSHKASQLDLSLHHPLSPCRYPICCKNTNCFAALQKMEKKKWNSTTKALISRTEFHPMWLANTPIDGCFKISSCGH